MVEAIFVFHGSAHSVHLIGYGAILQGSNCQVCSSGQLFRRQFGATSGAWHLHTTSWHLHTPWHSEAARKHQPEAPARHPPHSTYSRSRRLGLRQINFQHPQLPRISAQTIDINSFSHSSCNFRCMAPAYQHMAPAYPLALGSRQKTLTRSASEAPTP